MRRRVGFDLNYPPPELRDKLKELMDELTENALQLVDESVEKGDLDNQIYGGLVYAMHLLTAGSGSMMGILQGANDPALEAHVREVVKEQIGVTLENPFEE